MHGMIPVTVGHEVVEVFLQHTGFHLTVVVRKGDNLVFRKLYSTRLVYVDMSCAHTDDALILIEHRVDCSGIGLRTSCEEEYLRIG